MNTSPNDLANHSANSPNIGGMVAHRSQRLLTSLIGLAEHLGFFEIVSVDSIRRFSFVSALTYQSRAIGSEKLTSASGHWYSELE